MEGYNASGDRRRPDDVSLGCQKTFVLSARRGETVIETAEFRDGSGGNPRNLAPNVMATDSRPITPPSKSAVIGWQGNNGADTRVRQPMPTSTLHHRTFSERESRVEACLMKVLDPQTSFEHFVRQGQTEQSSKCGTYVLHPTTCKPFSS